MNVKETLTCKLCNEIYKHPVSLNCCGENICKRHIDGLISNNSSNKLICPFCNHENANKNFSVNRVIQNLIDNEMHKIELDPKYVKLLNEFKMEIEKLITLLNDPENYIYAEINETKRKVDSDRESLKSEIDKLADGMINQLESHGNQFKAEYSALVRSSKKQLSEYEKMFYLFSIKNEDREVKRNQNQNLINKIQTKINDLKNNPFSKPAIKYKPMQFKKEYLSGKLTINVRFRFKLEFIKLNYT